MARPPPPCPNTGSGSGSGGISSGNTGSLCLAKCMLLCGMHHRTHVADISHRYPFMTTKGVSTRPNTHPRTQEHMQLQHFATHMGPSCGLPKATNHSLYWIGTAKTVVSKGPKSADPWGRRVWTSPCSGKGGGGYL